MSCHGIQTSNDESVVTPLDTSWTTKKNRITVRLSSIISLIDVCQMDSNPYGFGLTLLTLPPVRRLVARPAKRADCSTMHPSAHHDQPPIKFVAAQFLTGAPLVSYLYQWRHLDTSRHIRPTASIQSNNYGIERIFRIVELLLKKGRKQKKRKFREKRGYALGALPPPHGVCHPEFEELP